MNLSSRLYSVSYPFTNFSARSLTRILAPCILFIMVLLTTGSGICEAALDQAAVELNNRGVALMGRFDYSAAREIFLSLSKQYPDNPDIKVNLAIAVLNRQEDGDETEALSILKKVLERHPENLRAQFCTGLLELHGGRPDVAVDHFKQVIALDPADVDALYFLAQCYMQQSQPGEALPWFNRVLEIDPYLLSAYYGSFQANQRLRNRKEARAMLNEFKRLKENPRSRAIEFKYMKMGQKSEVSSIDAPRPKFLPKPDGPLFASARDLAPSGSSSWTGDNRTSITYCDINGDDRLDIFIAGGFKTPEGSGNAVLLQTSPEGAYRLEPAHPLAGVQKVNAALWGDYDNDGLTDVYLLRNGPNQLWHQQPAGQWQDVGEATMTRGGDEHTVDGAFMDADHDGDLDLFLVNADGPNELFNNNLDGTFRPLAGEFGLAGTETASRAVLAADLDSDRDVDLLVVNRKPPHEVFINHLVWEYRSGQGWDALLNADITAAAAADTDADGRLEIHTLDSAGSMKIWRQSEKHVWEPTELKIPDDFTGRNLTGLALDDLDGDGRIEVVVYGPAGWFAAALEPDRLEILFTGQTDDRAGLKALALMASIHGPQITAWYPDGPRLWPAGSGRYQFAELMPSGREAPADSMRSNFSGIGVRFAVRVDSIWRMVDSCRLNSGPGQSLQPATVGLAGAPKIDFVAIDWSDGVFQTELNLEGARRYHITETQRQLSSCPVLFAWNGKEFGFISDLLGVGGIGYFLAPGLYSESRPYEHFMLPPDRIKAKNGRMLIKLTEPMEELTYLDAVRLKAYDLPPGWSMTLDERMGITEPYPTAEPLFYKIMVNPVKVVDVTGKDVTAAVKTPDFQAAPITPRDPRFIGLLTREQAITLTFSTPLEGPEGRALLLADGWIEYPYSQTNFAAWQAGAEYQAPSLDAAGEDGRFETVWEQFGYPAGMPHQMSIPLPKLPKDCRRLRLRTNQEIYWDRVAVVYARPCPEAKVVQLPLVAARMEQIGFPERADGPQHLPGYLFTNRRPAADMHIQEGLYTRIGPVNELLTDRDNAVAIFGPGEGVHIEFSEPETEIQAGWTRVFVVEVEGWCKDMDLYTKDGETVGPMPHLGEWTERAKELNRTFNTRFRSGRL